jgi:hypothetical protein
MYHFCKIFVPFLFPFRSLLQTVAKLKKRKVELREEQGKTKISLVPLFLAER